MMRDKNKTKRAGQALIPFALSIFALVGMAGLAVDAVLAALIRTNLSAAVDAGVLAAARVPMDEMDQMATSVFNANFEPGFLMSRNLTNSGLVYDATNDTISMIGSVDSPTFFMKAFGKDKVGVAASATALRRLGGGINDPDPPRIGRFIMIDEDTIDNGTPEIEVFCGADDAAECVNDDIANLYLRTYLFTRPSDEGWLDGENRILTLPTGQFEDEGIFEWRGEGLMESDQTGQTFSVSDLIYSQGNAANEGNLDKVLEIFPMRQADIEAMVGNIYCAVTWDSDISYDKVDHYAVLKGATTGLTAFEVIGLGVSGGSSSSFSGIEIELLPLADAQAACTSAASGEPIGGGSDDNPNDSGNPSGTLAVLLK